MTMKLDPTVKALWVDKLRNGGIEQRKGALCDTNGRMCCLGVLTELYIQQTGDDLDKRESNPDYLMRSAYSYRDGGAKVIENQPPRKVSQWAFGDDSATAENFVTPNITRDRPSGEVPVELWYLNDELNYTFDMIADVIEKGL